MRRLLCNQATVALAGVVLQIIASQYYHGVGCQKIGRVSRQEVPVKPFLKKFEPLIKRGRKPFFSSLIKVPVEEQVIEKEATDPVVGSVPDAADAVDTSNTAVYGKKITEGLQKTGKFADNFVDDWFSENTVDSGSDPVVGSAKDGSDAGGYGFKDRILKTGKFVDNLMDRFFSDSGGPMVGSSKGGGSKGGYGKKLGTFFDKFLVKLLPGSGNDGGGSDPMVGSAQGSGGDQGYRKNFEGTLRKTGKFFDKFLNEVITDSGNSDSGGDPVVGSAQGDANSQANGTKFEDRLQKSGKFVDTFVNKAFSVFDSSEESDDRGYDPVVGSTQGGGDGGGSQNYGGHFEDALHHTGKFVDMFMGPLFRGSEDPTGGDSSSDPMVGSARDIADDDDSGMKIQHYLRKTGKYVDKFVNRLFGGFGDSGANSEIDPILGSANPNIDPSGADEISNDIDDDTVQPIEDQTTTEAPKSEELFKDLEDDSLQGIEDKCDDCDLSLKDDEELFPDLNDNTASMDTANGTDSTCQQLAADSNEPFT